MTDSDTPEREVSPWEHGTPKGEGGKKMVQDGSSALQKLGGGRFFFFLPDGGRGHLRK